MRSTSIQRYDRREGKRWRALELFASGRATSVVTPYEPDMNGKNAVAAVLPETFRSYLARAYQQVSHQPTDEELHAEFVDDFFDSRTEYDRYADEFEGGPVAEIRDEAFRDYRRMTNKDTLADVGLEVARDYYAITRKVKPDTVVETGVCNGVSTLSILLALDENGSGRLYSIDYPFRADESLEQFKEETFDDYGGAAIPSDKDPGWIIPEKLRGRWELIVGKSQRELPRLVVDLETIDLFVHDSEHSHPCMMFEYELAYEWLEEGGIILSDDITWNDAFPVFTQVREPVYGKLSDNVGIMEKRTKT